MLGVRRYLAAEVHVREGKKESEDFWRDLHGFQLEQWGISRHQQSIKGTIEG